MKKVYISIIVILIGLNLSANPVAPPTIRISEFYFDEHDDWVLELQFFIDEVQLEMSIDSICLRSKIDAIKLPKRFFKGNYGLVVINNDSLDTVFKIDRYSDTLQVVYHIRDFSSSDMLIFGNCSGSKINYPRNGQSLSRIESDMFSKDKSPTIGQDNDTLGMCGTLKGVVYDKLLRPIANRTFSLDFPFKTTANGRFLTRVYSKPSNCNSIYLVSDRGGYRNMSIYDLTYIMEPDSIIERNMYLLDTLTSGINDVFCSEDPVQISPNPVSVNGILTVSVDLPVHTSDIWLELFDAGGKQIRKERIIQKNTLIEAPLQAGAYLLAILHGNSIISSKKVVVKN